MQEFRKNKIAGGELRIMIGASCLQKSIAGIQRQEQSHEHDFCDQDVIRIAPGPAVKVATDKPPQPDDISSDKKYRAGNNHQHGQNFKSVDQEAIKSPEYRGKQPVCSDDAIQYNFQDL